MIVEMSSEFALSQILTASASINCSSNSVQLVWSCSKLTQLASLPLPGLNKTLIFTTMWKSGRWVRATVAVNMKRTVSSFDARTRFSFLMLGRNALFFTARCSSEQHVLCPIHRSSHSQISLNFLVTTSTAFIQLTVTDSQGKASFELLWTESPITTAGPCIQLSSSLHYLPRDQITEMLSPVFSVFSEGEYFIPDPQFIRPSRGEGRGLAAVLTHHHSCKRLLILHA